MSLLTSSAPIVLERVPEHVPDELVYDFDYRYDPGLIADPHQRIAEVLKEAPGIFYTLRHGGHWVFVSHKAVTDGARTPEIFSSVPRLVEGQIPFRVLPLMSDPPEHALYRNPLNKIFGLKSMLLLRESIRELARDLISEVADKGECDFIAAIGEPLPVLTFLRLMGMPLDKMPVFRDIVKKVHGGSSPEEGMALMGTVAGIMEEFIVLRRDKPEDDVISLLWQSQIGDRPITIEEIRMICMLLYTAGLDTVVNAMGFAARHLAQDPELQTCLRNDHSKIPAASEEMLRRYGIVMLPRVVTRDCEMYGVQFREGDSVLLVTPAGNLDETAFKDPGVYNVDRETIAHLTFNSGPHRCVGQHLARLELHILYEELLAGLPEFRLDPDKPVHFTSGNVLTVHSLPIRWDV